MDFNTDEKIKFCDQQIEEEARKFMYSASDEVRAESSRALVQLKIYRAVLEILRRSHGNEI